MNSLRFYLCGADQLLPPERWHRGDDPGYEYVTAIVVARDRDDAWDLFKAACGPFFEEENATMTCIGARRAVHVQ